MECHLLHSDGTRDEDPWDLPTKPLSEKRCWANLQQHSDHPHGPALRRPHRKQGIGLIDIDGKGDGVELLTCECDPTCAVHTC